MKKELLNINFKNINLIFLISFIYSCVTPTPKNQSELDLPQRKQNIIKPKPDFQKKKFIQQSTKENLFIFISNPNNILGENEKELLIKISNLNDKNYFDNALLALATIKIYLTLNTDENKYNTNTLTTNNASNKKPSTTTSLQKTADKYQIDLIEQINNNILLESTVFILYAKKICKLNKQEDTDYIHTLSKKINSWNEILKKEELTEQDTTNINTNNNLKPLPFESSDFNKRNILDLLSEAEILVNEEKHFEAIQILKSIEENSIYYETAQIKTIEISNTAITKMRQLAAEAFNKAIPLSDKSARKHYLEKAQSILENARSSFPDSNKIDTINKNLEIIKSNLKIIED